MRELTRRFNLLDQADDEAGALEVLKEVQRLAEALDQRQFLELMNIWENK